MGFPKKLQAAIELEAAKFSLQAIGEARQRLTARYRQRDERNFAFMRTAAERCAYIAARMPATYAVCSYVLQELSRRCPEVEIASILDLGAGPGTASWAAAMHFPAIRKITLMEQDGELIAIGKRLAAWSSLPALQDGCWQQCHLDGQTKLKEHDVVICSYAVGELPKADLLPFISACWHGTQKFLVIVEPGTPSGFERISLLRQALIDMQGHMVAPCTHLAACPLLAPRESKSEKWCHFSLRLERSFLHAHIKEGCLGFEDEKFSYLIFAKNPIDLPAGRLLGAPRKHSGHVGLEICSHKGEESRIVSKKTPELYHLARKLRWGDALD